MVPRHQKKVRLCGVGYVASSADRKPGLGLRFWFGSAHTMHTSVLNTNQSRGSCHIKLKS